MAQSNDSPQGSGGTVPGEEVVEPALLPAVYGELRRLAQHHLRHERPGHTLNATALVHEAYLKLASPSEEPSWQDRAHFKAVASRAMRQILVDYARHRSRQKRGGDAVRVSFVSSLFAARQTDENILVLEAALNRLESLNPEHSRIVECRYFGGLTIEETAMALNLSASTVKRGWRAARSFLALEIKRLR